ncbi:nuclear transport factor 2 family protein [Kribbella qitaiheensis]|uniref:Nuclear transport factor 2 family protein n=1 Tax=Kribbella qitaiheensis TaxID=1544730 RepID=A0A7G6WX62_9ACTN|nr:nuclear transport factor 2 family protein [Kribbella qitaiheensis]QNE18577.1 nuclear transport factor 2 family protein [Kribbella qitaiheensis]
MSDAEVTQAEANAAVVRRYLKVFETRDVEDLAEVMAEDVRVRGAGQTVTGRHHVAASGRRTPISGGR